ncbi:hypothetical protein CAPTEDRAFT_209439 [Capitella teleta]|uniref:Uncharacterized protein n=1 Tax=Capitella teleta TaxID=283909 RepID=R7ULM3_CAPTE|nr:hypothetical protein CAPTEDRAFT_209439 [Capitella teleta]|eukprot:ELU07439.1 hypothetical protein CAPTEDRAFT_209439 [Capitella teleta]
MEDHITHVINKARIAKRQLMRMRPYCTPQQLPSLYKPMVWSALKQGSVCYAHASEPLYYANYKLSSKNLLKNNLLRLEDLRKLLELKYFYKWKNGVLLAYFDTFISVGIAEEHRLRVLLHRHHFYKLGLRYSITNTEVQTILVVCRSREIGGNCDPTIISYLREVISLATEILLLMGSTPIMQETQD